MPRHRDRQRGSGSIELAVVAPLVMLLTLLSIHAAMYAHTRAVLRTVTREAVHATAAYDGSAAAGKDRGQRYLGRLGGRTVSDETIQVTRTATHARATITATVNGPLPWPDFVVRQTSAAPVERFAPSRVSP